MSDLARLYRASAHSLPMVETGSVQSVITSPPYFGLRKYDGEQEIDWPAVRYSPMAGLPPLEIPAQRAALGNEKSIEAYIAHLILCAREWRRCLHDTGTLFVNLGDSYAGANYRGGGVDTASSLQRNNRGSTAFMGQKAPALPEGIRAKNLLMVPARFALAMQADGWILRSEMVWAKPNPMPESVTDRPTKAHEMIYLFSKQERYFWDADAVRTPHKPESIERDKAGWSAAFKGRHTMPGEKRPHSTDTNGFLNPNGSNMRTVLTVATQPYSQAHFAVWPVALVEPMIKAGSRAGDTVLDPFSGSGTTGRVAVALGRRYIGIDLAAEYLDTLAPERLTVQMEMI